MKTRKSVPETKGGNSPNKPADYVVSGRGGRNRIEELEKENQQLRASNLQLQKSIQDSRVTRDYYADLFEHLPAGCLISGSDGRLLDVNSTLLSQLSLNRQFIVGHPVNRLVSPVDTDRYSKHIKGALDSGRSSTCYLSLIGGEGKAFPARLDSIVVEDCHGLAGSVMSLVSGVGESRQTWEVLHTLHEITAAQDMSFDDKLRALLEYGCRRFNVPIGILSHIHEDSYEVIQVVAPDGSIRAGDILNLGKTYCRETLKADSAIGFEHAGVSEWHTHPCYGETRLEAYLGIPVTAGGEVYGTLSFSSPRSLDVPFSNTDKGVIHLMAQWVGSEISQQLADKELRSKERQLRQVIDLVPHMIFARDRNGNFLLANRVMAEMYGTTVDQLMIQGPGDVAGDEARLDCKLVDDDGVVESQSPTFVPEEEFRDSAGELHVLQTTKIPFTESGSNIPAVLGIAVDITEQKSVALALKKERDRAQQYLDVAGVIIIVIKRDQRVSLINKTGCDVLGYNEQEILGKNWFDHFIPERIREDLRQGFIAMIHDNVDTMQHYENPVLSKGGTEKIIAWHNQKLRDEEGKVISTLSSGNDITERRKIENSRATFFSIASHELRTPLTNLGLSLDMIVQNSQAGLPAHLRTMLDIARRSSDRLKRLVDEFMDIQKLETGGMAFEFDVLDLMSIIEESIIASSAFAEQFGVRYLLGHSLSGVMVEADSDRIMQVLTNLLSNAAKYSHAGDLVEISVARHGEMVRISVTDHGPGVPESFRDEIFNPFTQAEPSLEDERHKDSAGLGLSIAKAIVEKHGGRIGFDSVHNTATTFYFDLPEWKIQPVNKQVHSG